MLAGWLPARANAGSTARFHWLGWMGLARLPAARYGGPRRHPFAAQGRQVERAVAHFDQIELHQMLELGRRGIFWQDV
jgi:hypothetical protein